MIRALDTPQAIYATSRDRTAALDGRLWHYGMKVKSLDGRRLLLREFVLVRVTAS
jgi:hypothetical protein